MNNESVTVYKMIIHYLQVRQCILEMVRAYVNLQSFHWWLEKRNKGEGN